VRRIFAILVLLPLLLWGNASADLKEDFDKGVEAYNQGDYQQALDIFKAVLDSGYVSPELYYNLGNSYYKNGQRGMAVASYLQAQRLAPRNEDIRANLHFVRSTLRDKIEDSLQNPIWEFIKDTSFYFRTNELTWIAFAIYIIITAFLIFMVIYRRKNIAVLSILFTAVFLLVVSISLLAINININYHTPRAVITEPEVDILAGPGAISEVRFTAHEGLTFQILKQESGYYEGIFANKLKGWVEISKAYQF
jgi:tetratricopeptide (TPR) repeat protein